MVEGVEWWGCGNGGGGGSGGGVVMVEGVEWWYNHECQCGGVLVCVSADMCR